MQGQAYDRVLDAGNAPTSPLCQVRIKMNNGKVSTPHVHHETHVYVHVTLCGPQGVLTLWGPALENEEWSFEGDTLWIPPGVPHVAIYPAYHDAPPLSALETRTAPSPEYDVVPLPDLWLALGQRLDELKLLRSVDLPTPAQLARNGG